MLIINKNILEEISNLAQKYRQKWKLDLCESEDIEEYGENEFIGGKAEAYEECLDIIKNQLLSNQLLSMDTITRELENIAQIFTTHEGIGINYSDIYFWKDNATQAEIDKMSFNIIKVIDGEFDFDDEEIYLIAKSIVEKIKAISQSSKKR